MRRGYFRHYDSVVVTKINVEGKRGKRKPTNMWIDGIKSDIKIVGGN